MILNRNLLHTKFGREETCEHLSVVLGECCISCELELAGPEYECQQGFSSIPETIAEKLFSCEFSSVEDGSQAIISDTSRIKKASVVIDNLLSPVHSLLQIQCHDQKGLIYDILRISKDCGIQVYNPFCFNFTNPSFFIPFQFSIITLSSYSDCIWKSLS